MANIIHTGESTWKLVGTATGTAEIDLPDGWKEVHIEAVKLVPSQGLAQIMTCNFIKKSETANSNNLYFGSSAIEFAYNINYEAGKLKLVNALISGDNVTAYVTSYIYYK